MVFTCILVPLLFFLSNFERNKEDFGYKKDYSIRTERILNEIPSIIAPYKINKIESVQQGPLAIIKFYIEVDKNDYKKINNILKSRINLIGFNGICRLSEAIFVSYNEMMHKTYIIIKWQYPTEACNSKS